MAEETIFERGSTEQDSNTDPTEQVPPIYEAFEIPDPPNEDQIVNEEEVLHFLVSHSCKNYNTINFLQFKGMIHITM